MIMQETLILGSHSVETSQLYKKFGLSPSKLVLSPEQEYLVGHTSRQDFRNVTELENVLQKANTVLWGDPDPLDFGEKEVYYNFLDWLKQYQYKFGNISNFVSIKFDPYNWLPNKNIIDAHDLVALGCSMTFGIGFADVRKTWSSLVANNLGLQNKNLGQPGGSLQKLFLTVWISTKNKQLFCRFLLCRESSTCQKTTNSKM